MWQVFDRGFLGVDFFFVLSGFLITTLLLREEGRNGSFSFAGFYWRRLLRIFPVYYLVVTASTLYFGLVKDDPATLERAPMYYLFLSNFLIEQTTLLDPTWSLSVEEQYYLLWPIALAWLPRRWLVPACLAAIGVNYLGSAGFFRPLFGTGFRWGNLLWFRLPTATYAPILLGSLCALWLHRERSYTLLSRLLAHRTAPAILFILLLLLCQYTPVQVHGWPNLVLHLAMAMTMVSLLVNEQNVLCRFLTWGPVVRIGEVSYGIYLYHLIARHGAILLQERFLQRVHPLVTLLLMIFMSLALAEISYRSLEAFFRRLKTKTPFFFVPWRPRLPDGKVAEKPRIQRT